MKAVFTLKRRNVVFAKASVRIRPSDFNQTPEKVEVNVGAIILSPGLEPFDPKVKEEYRYGQFANVVTSMDYERLLSATGAYQGEILRVELSASRATRCFAFCGAKLSVTRCGKTRNSNAFIDGNWRKKASGKAKVAAGRKLGIRLWIMLRDNIDYEEFCRRGRQTDGVPSGDA